MLSSIRRPRASPSNWRALLGAVCVAQAAAIIGFDFTLPFIPLYLQHDLGIHGVGQTALWAGLIGFGPAIPATIFAPLWGRVADRFGYRLMLLRAMVAAALLLTLMGLAPNPVALLILRLAQGALTGTVFSAQALVAASVPEKETGRAMGLLQMSIYAGATVGPVGGGVVAQLLGYRFTFVSAGIMLAAASLIVLVFVYEPPSKAKQKRHTHEEHAGLLTVLRIPAFVSALILTLFVQLAGTSLFPIIPLFVEELLHTTRGVASDTGWLLALSGLAAAAGSYASGRLQKHFGLKPLLLIFLGLSSALFLPQAFVGSFSGFLVLRSLAALAYGALFGLVGTLAALSSPKDAKGAAFGLIGAASSLGFGAGPLLGGICAATFGIRPLFVLAAVVLAITPLFLFATSLVSASRMGTKGRPGWSLSAGNSE